MIAFLLSVLGLLLYAAICVVCILIFAFFFEWLTGKPVPPRIMSVLYLIVALACTIWLLQSLLTHTPVPLPWNWQPTR